MEIQKIETIKPNSFMGRWNGTGTDFKIYFDTIEDLKAGIDAVMDGKAYFEKKIAESNGEKNARE